MKDNMQGSEIWELNTQSFVVRIWCEEAGAGAPAVWRGHITHVSSGNRRHIDDLMQITAFVAGYLRDMGVDCPIQP